MDGQGNAIGEKRQDNGSSQVLESCQSSSLAVEIEDSGVLMFTLSLGDGERLPAGTSHGWDIELSFTSGGENAVYAGG